MITVEGWACLCIQTYCTGDALFTTRREESVCVRINNANMQVIHVRDMFIIYTSFVICTLFLNVSKYRKFSRVTYMDLIPYCMYIFNLDIMYEFVLIKTFIV